MTKSFNVKALGAFKKLGAVALITAATLALAGLSTSCKQTPTPTPKHEVAFGVEGGQSQGGQSGQGTAGGTLKAKADGIAETEKSPITIEQGKVITFKAEAKAGYSVKSWTLDGKPITLAGTNTEYKLKVSKPATVKVSFEEIPKHAVTFSVDSTTPNGILKAKAEGITETGTSPITVEHGKEVTFTATADDGYKIGKWTVTGSVLEGSTGADGSETAKVKITADTTVSVSFELNPVEGGAVLILSPDKLNIKLTAKTADGSDITVEGCNETTLRSHAWTELHAKGTKVILKGNITELSCDENKLTELNVQGLTALKNLWCLANQLNAQAMTKLLNALPAREAGDNASAVLYTEQTAVTEGNCKDFSQPADLKKAFEDAKSRNWKLKKFNASGSEEDI